MGTSATRRRRLRAAVEAMEPRVVPSVTIQVRYDYDTSGFFAATERRQAMQAAANQMGAMLGDRLAAIQAGDGNSWTAHFDHPVTGASLSLVNLAVPADTLIVFVGGADLPPGQLGEGGPGGRESLGTPEWHALVLGRGQAGALGDSPTDFAPWGGMIRFDSAGTDWSFATTSGPGPSQSDFLSVAMHELGHVLGIGTSESWNRYVNTTDDLFRGPASVAANGGAAVPLGNDAHWGGAVRSDGRPPAMAPALLVGTRDLFTRLDRAGLSDIGWQVVAPPPVVATAEFAAAAVNVPEAAGAVRLRVTRTASDATATIAWTVRGAGATPGVDLGGATTGVVTFAAGQAAADIVVPIVNDRLKEGTERFTVTLSGPSGVALGAKAVATVTIVDDDRAPQGDRDGDGRADLIVFGPADARWLGRMTMGAGFATSFGGTRWASLPVPADYDGDGRVDLAVFRPADARWQVSLSRGGTIDRAFGARNLADLPVPADYDGDGRADLVVFRVAEGRWLGTLSGGGTLDVRNAPTNLSQVPVPADYDGDGKADLALFRPADATWTIPQSGGGGTRRVAFGRANWGSLPVPADYDGDGRADLAVFRPADARWQASLSRGGTLDTTYGARSLAQVPIFAPIGALRRLRVLV